MIKQVWVKLTIRTNKPEATAVNLAKSDKVRNIQVLEGKVEYEQIGWKQDNTEHLDREDG